MSVSPLLASLLFRTKSLLKDLPGHTLGSWLRDDRLVAGSGFIELLDSYKKMGE